MSLLLNSNDQIINTINHILMDKQDCVIGSEPDHP